MEDDWKKGGNFSLRFPPSIFLFLCMRAFLFFFLPAPVWRWKNVGCKWSVVVGVVGVETLGRSIKICPGP